MISLLLIVFVVTTVVVKYFRHMRRMESYVKHLNIKGLVIPFIGNVHVLLGKSSQQLFKAISTSTLEIGTPIKAYVGPFLFVILDKPEDLKTIITSPHTLEKPYVYKYMPNGNGILVETSAVLWRPIRKLMNPAFSMKVLQSSMHIFNSETSNWMKYFSSNVGKSEFDVFPMTNKFTLRMMCGTTMGIDSMSHDDVSQFLHSMETVFETVIKRFLLVWTQPSFIYRWTSLYQTERKHYDIIQNFTDKVFDEKKAGYFTKACKNESCEKVPLALIDHLLESYFSGRCSERVIKEQMETALMAGSDTTAYTVSFAILMLAMHPDVQEKLFEELHSMYDAQNEETSFEQLQKLPFLDWCTKETMRLFPVASVIGRTTNVDIPISNCTIPKEAIIMMSIFTLHRRKDVWGDDVGEFNPERFSPENVSKRHPFSFLPFSSGPRNCIGYQQAMILMKVLLSACVRNFKLSTHLKMSELELKYDVTLKLINKHMVSMEKRAW